MKYFEAKLQNKHSSSSLHEPEIAEPASDDSLWPAESGESEAAPADKKFDLTARNTSLLNLDSSWLRDVLLEKPTSNSNDGKGPQVQSSTKIAASQVSNNNFSLMF